jgi:hypothetical protein
MREPVGRQQHPASMFARSWLVNRPSRLIRTTAGPCDNRGVAEDSKYRACSYAHSWMTRRAWQHATQQNKIARS